MPLYEYECQSCHRRIEKIQSFSDAPLTDCPSCGGHLEKTITAPAFTFKGSGWYVNDYAARPKDANTGSASGAATAAPASDSSATKPDSSSSDSSAAKAPASGDSSASASPSSSGSPSGGTS